GGIESYAGGHTRGEGAKRHFHRLGTISRSYKPYRFFDFSPGAIRDCVVTRQALDLLVTQSVGRDVNGAASRMPFPDAQGLQPKRDGSVVQRFPKRLDFVEVHAVDDGPIHDWDPGYQRGKDTISHLNLALNMARLRWRG